MLRGRSRRKIAALLALTMWVGFAGGAAAGEIAARASGFHRNCHMASREGFYPLSRCLVLRPRDALRLALSLVPLAAVEETVEVRGAAPGLDPQGTESSIYVTHDTIAAMPENATEDLPTLAEYSLPGAVGGHDNFVHVRGNELSLH